MEVTTKIGKYLTVGDVIRSTTALRKGIDNSLPEELLPSITAWVENIYDPLCDKFGIQIPFGSIYRSKKLNEAIGGSDGSQHVKAEAGDLDADGLIKFGISNAAIFQALLTMEFDQLIWEYGNDDQPAWVHVSYSLLRSRGQVLRCYNRKGKRVYETYSKEPA